MIELWLGIILLTLLAMSFLCWPLFKKTEEYVDIDRKKENVSIFQHRLAELQLEKEQLLLTDESFDELKLELEKNLLSDAAAIAKPNQHRQKTKRRLLIVIVSCLLLPMISLGFYSKYGHYDDLVWSAKNKELNALKGDQRPTLEQAIVMLEAELERAPENAEGWYMLAGSYMSASEFNKGAQAFNNVLKYLPEQSPQYASVIGQYAQALFFVDNKVSAQVKAQIQRALAIDNSEVISLGLLGIEAFERAQYQQAIGYWKKALVNAQPNAIQGLESGIAKAQQELARLGIAPSKAEKTLATAAEVNAESNAESVEKSKLKVIVDVEITEQLKSELDENTTIFVFAKPIAGRIPLAALKLRVADLPKRVVLDDSLAMLATAKISMQQKVEVSARISLSGQPQPQAGDYESNVLILDVSEVDSAAKLLINNLVK
ncbi:c-type cytochrome biogenesis protein CcmI [Gammaproteobacteria bacterium AS21]